ncbi:hypothetical protein EMIHUDRAFT_97380 [Emiliania huxleyi CCMP1516]|uniref:Uncharacterized protein n=2 Tax=Emiliania huxleyi TaxID=2903 RepID=A0A0D3KZD1_EMIH1|nr:hypothetical protein EMIHUDRAFT_97380 [Emiliania huxleyi CCMP1516]EOD41116.1 hypothetical protein EMIHUDRAFT_97380 [Emiliania huxleyi CCMP1516]|eukprot:XP_005793545.1 hypothetical protein EMIHUDRAFT_97380 [Emiliania huxleyi CCMP1516]
MVPTGETLGDTSVVNNACDLAHIHSVRSIRSENIDGEFCAGLDGKPSDMNCSVMASKVGALAVGAKADNTSEANGLIPPDKFCDNPSCPAHPFLPKLSTEDGAESEFLFFNIPVSAAEHSIITELVVPKIDAESKAVALGQTIASKIDVDKIFSVGTRFTKLLSDARLSLNSFTSPSIADAFMLSAIGTASVNNDWDSSSSQPAMVTTFSPGDGSALADVLEAEDDERQDEAARGDEQPMLAPHGPALSVQLRRVRLQLREFLATQAAAGKSVPMQRTALGLHPTMRWTIRFGKWLATTRVRALRASRWHATERGDAREEEPTVRAGRGENTVYVALH